MERDRQIFLLFFTILPTPSPPSNLKNQNFENGKKAWRYHHFTQMYQKS